MKFLLIVWYARTEEENEDWEAEVHYNAYDLMTGEHECSGSIHVCNYQWRNVVDMKLEEIFDGNNIIIQEFVFNE